MPLSWTVHVARRMLSRVLRRPSRAPPRTRRIKPPFRRKLLFEMLEPRVLLSADPLASLDGAGALTATLTQDADHVVVQQTGTAANGGVIVDITVGETTETYGSAEEGILGITLEGLGGDDTFEFIDLTASVTLQGGEGSDSLIGPAAGAEWTIDGANAGSVSCITFS